MNVEEPKFQNLNLNFLQLMIILSMNAGLPTLVLGSSLKQIADGGAVIVSIIVGNLILWLIGTAIISMAYEERINAIENARIHIGKFGAILVAGILALSLINWFVILINGSITTLNQHFDLGSFWNQGASLRIGAAIGLLCALFSIGKLNLIRWLSIFGFPVIFLYYLWMLFSADYSSESWSVSSITVITTILIYLPGVMNLPTIFRHSRSKADSFLGFALMMLMISFFQISSVLTPVSAYFIHPLFTAFALITYSLLCNNLTNIYFASACWETFMPNTEGIRGGVIFGLIGVLLFTLIKISPQTNLLFDLTNSYLSNFVIVFLVSFLSHAVIRHRPIYFAKIINTIAWIIGCVAATIFKLENHESGIYSLISGIGFILLFYLIIIFIEEVIWSTKTLKS